jgi:hypothetical protein
LVSGIALREFLEHVRNRNSGHALKLLPTAVGGRNLVGMSKTRSEVLAESKRKGVAAGVVGAAAVTAAIVVGPFTAAVAAVPAAVLTYRWWKHRAENGIKF